jgi:hypothetical protein
MKSAMGVAGLVAGGIGASAITPRAAFAQLLEAGIREDSMLAKVKKQGVLRVG